MSVNYKVGDFVKFNTPLNYKIYHVGVILKVIVNKDDIFRSIVLEIYSFDDMIRHTTMPFFDEIDLL